ncbi:MAG: 16S rRNA (guanine(527)-N(7))-methyltransferase RsmG [Proteobacteria bacterium]|nr:16S rRNA (guanine(527)-N(7))-methyltransferase RsmG [Pseudomonadota bacterium]
MTAHGFQEISGVSDEALKRLETFVAVLEKWRTKINLVGRGTLADPWRRHILDSAQLGPLLPSGTRSIADMGSGAGFPGLVLALMDLPGGPDVHLIESNQRKCAFLNEVNRATGAGAVIHHCRIENLANLSVDVATARGVAPLTKLLQFAVPILKKDGKCFFLKGKKWQDELTKAKKDWNMEESYFPSLSNSSGMVLKLEALSRRHDS